MVHTMAKVPANAEVLRWAVGEAGVSVDRIAEATSRPVATVESWLAGSQSPFRGDLTALAQLIGRSPQFFLRTEIPTQTDVVRTSKRSPIAADDDGAESADELKAVRKADSVRKVAAWSAKLASTSSVTLPPVTAQAAKYARSLRKWLDWDTREAQIKATSKSATFKLLRAEVEAAGVIVLVIDFGGKSSRGFSINDDLAPVIVINGSIPLASVKTYTLLHELAHLGRGDVTLHHVRDSAVERWCEAVAADFLMPRSELVDYIETYRKKTHFAPTDLDDVRLISNRFKASWFSVAIRLKELGFADQRLVDAVSAGGEKDGKGFSTTPQTRPLRRLTEFGSAYPRLLLGAMEQERISALDTRKYLRLQSADELADLGSILQQGA